MSEVRLGSEYSKYLNQFHIVASQALNNEGCTVEFLEDFRSLQCYKVIFP